MAITADSIQIVRLDDADIIAQVEYPAEDEGRIVIEIGGEFHAYVDILDQSAIAAAVADILNMHPTAIVGLRAAEGPFYSAAAWEPIIDESAIDRTTTAVQAFVSARTAMQEAMRADHADGISANTVAKRSAGIVSRPVVLRILSEIRKSDGPATSEEWADVLDEILRREDHMTAVDLMSFAHADGHAGGVMISGAGEDDELISASGNMGVRWVPQKRWFEPMDADELDELSKSEEDDELSD